MTTHGRRKAIIHLFFFAIFLGGGMLSWMLPSSLSGLSLIFTLAWFPVCQWISGKLVAALGWKDDPNEPSRFRV